MWRFYIIGLSLLLCFDTLGQISFKFTALHAAPIEFSWRWIVRIFSQPWSYINLASYSGAFLVWMMLLRKAPVGPAFAASHLQVVSVMLFSAWLFNEQISWLKLLGALLIVTGIISLALAERQLAHQKIEPPESP